MADNPAAPGRRRLPRVSATDTKGRRPPGRARRPERILPSREPERLHRPKRSPRPARSQDSSASKPAESVSIIISTIGSEEKARVIARRLVEGRHAACVNIVPGLRSLYRWKGRIEDDAELLLIVKTSSSRVGEAMEALHKLHPYEVPEMLVLEVSQGFAPYLQWIMENTTTAS